MAEFGKLLVEGPDLSMGFKGTDPIAVRGVPRPKMTSDTLDHQLECDARWEVDIPLELK